MAGDGRGPSDMGPANRLFRYWAYGDGVAKWAEAPDPWTTLRNLLMKYVPKNVADGLASNIFHAHFGYWSGDRKGANPVGPG